MDSQEPMDDSRDYDAEEKDKKMEKVWDSKIEPIHTCNSTYPCERCRADFAVEGLKYSIIADLHALEGRIGRDQCRAWIKANFVDLPF